MEDLITLIIPIYNERDYIEPCLQSIITQPYTHLQIILVDDGSKKECQMYYDTLSKVDNRIELYHIPNGGVSNARNFGLSKAKGKWIIFVDSDDYMLEDSIRYLVEHINKTDFVLGDYVRSSEETILSSPTYEYRSSDNIRKMLLDYNKNIDSVPFIDKSHTSYFHSVWGKVYNADIIRDNNIRFNTELVYSEDTVFNLDYINCITSGVLTNRPVYFYRQNLKSATHRFSSSTLEKVFNLIDHVTTYPYEEANAFCCYYLLSTYLNIIKCGDNAMVNTFFDYISEDRIHEMVIKNERLPSQGIQGKIFTIVTKLWKHRKYKLSVIVMKSYILMKHRFRRQK